MIVLPVIHYTNPRLALYNARVALEASCQGVFLISMDGDDSLIPAAALKVKQAFPQLRVGINLLGVDPLVALDIATQEGLDMTWHDNPGILNGVTPSCFNGFKLPAGHELYGSVAFKYQVKDPQAGASAVAAARLGMITTTSGKGTGSAPSLEKIQCMSECLRTEGYESLAVASGLDPTNIHLFSPYISHALVCTGIAKDFYTFDDAKLKAFVEASQLGTTNQTKNTMAHELDPSAEGSSLHPMVSRLAELSAELAPQQDDSHSEPVPASPAAPESVAPHQKERTTGARYSWRQSVRSKD